MKKRINGTYAFKTDKGKIRVINEDNSKIFVNSQKDIFFVITDGMGGQNKGDVASKLIIDIIEEEFEKKKRFLNTLDVQIWIQNLYLKINTRLFKETEIHQECKGLGATLVSAFLYKNKLIVTNVGDSRCYIYKDDDLILLTEDQTYANYLFKSGRIEHKDIQTHKNRHVLTNAMGMYPSISYEQKVFTYDGEKIFLCSDGLYNNLSIKDINAILSSNESTREKVNSLISCANYNGGTDNITVILWENIDD